MWFLNYLLVVLFGDHKGQDGPGLTASAPLGAYDVVNMLRPAIEAIPPADLWRLPPSQVSALSTDQIGWLSTAVIAALSTDQIVAISPQDLAAMNTAQIEALVPGQMVVLNSAQIQAITTAQFPFIETLDLAALTSSQIGSITSSQMPWLTTSQVVALTTGQAKALSTAAVTVFTTDQIVALEPVDLASLTTAQVVALSTQSVHALSSTQVQTLTDPQIAVLTTDQINALQYPTFFIPSLSTSDIAALSTFRITHLSTSQIASLSTDQVIALTTSAIALLSTEQIAAMETQDLRVLTTNQIATLTSAQTHALNSVQQCAFATSQFPAFTNEAWQQILPTPIILDLNGDGVKTQSIANGVKFDIFADGQAINTGWVSTGDGLLVLDRNHDGTINDASELFGSSTKLASGAKAPDGYAALRELDTNHDGVISSADAVYADLRLWVDSNSDGVSQSSELKTLDSLGIASINVNATAGTSTDNGNIVGLTSTYQTTDGATHAAADVWFVADKGGTNASAGTLDAAIAALSSATAHTVVPDVLNVAADTPIVTAPLVAQPVGANTDLRSRASSLAQAIGSFGDGSGTLDTLSAPRLDTLTSMPSASSAATLAVGSMVDVMKQFDANGNLIASPLTTASSAKPVLKVPGVNDPTNTGILSSGGV